ncbi:catalase-like domain-containing protein [Xylariaceae sp. FL1019]|nr:catalase-like domain-containing protein [Xylariaceae sp. FL1019]
MTELARRTYLRWDVEGVEQVSETEAEDIKRVIELINESQRRIFDQSRHCFGGTHARTQGLVKGKLVVSDGLPPYLQQTELFEKPGEFPVACRYSSEPGDPSLDDRIPQPRGFTMKVFHVQGKMMEGNPGVPTQDIEFNSAPAIELADARTTREIVSLRLQYGDEKEKLYKALHQREDSDLQTARDKVPNLHLASLTWYSQSAYRFGDFVIKYSLVPAPETLQTLRKAWKEIRGEQEQHNGQATSPKAEEANGGFSVDPARDSRDVLHRWLQKYHAEHEAQFIFRVQLLEDLHEQPVEYTGKVWDEAKFPWQEVARLIVPRQESFSAARRAFWEDHMRVDPWHGLETFRPLGSSNRLRKALYPASSALRRKLNAREEIHVTSIAQIPD